MNDYRSIEEMVREFHDAMGVESSTLIDEEAVLCREHLIDEEKAELEDAIDFRDPEAIMKEACDLVYVVVGTLIKFNLSFDEAFRRVHESNMTKLWPDGKPRYREDGKILKPPDYEPPDLEDLV